MPRPTLTGLVCFPKETSSDDFWNSESFDRPRAWMDLWFLANDRQRAITIRGASITVERGQLAWSMVQLAERWRWSRPKTDAFLTALLDDRRIMVKKTNLTTIITVMDYTVYNRDSAAESAPDMTAVLTTELTPESTPDLAADFTQKVEEGSKKREVGKGEAPARATANGHFPEVEVPGLNDFLAACLEQGIPQPYAEREYAWRSERPAARWPLGSSWRTAVTSTLVRWRSEQGSKKPEKKQGADGTSTATGSQGRSPAQARFEIDRELRELRARLNAAHELTMEPDAADVAREKILEKQLAELT